MGQTLEGRRAKRKIKTCHLTKRVIFVSTEIVPSPIPSSHRLACIVPVCEDFASCLSDVRLFQSFSSRLSLTQSTVC